MHRVFRNERNLKQLNNILGITVVVLALYIFIWPFLPAVTWWARYQAPLRSHAADTSVPLSDPVPNQSTLVIPKLDMKDLVHGGSSQSALNKGIWHLPDNSTPEKGGNTIMAGHRFTYSGQAVFYNLDKVAVGDEVTLYWQGKRYDYLVIGKNVVPPTDNTLIAQTSDPTLTLYTCTPLWSAKDRLVITAKLVETR